MTEDDDTFQTLLKAWKRWVRSPASEQAAVARVDAIIAFATEVGMSTVEVSRRMSAGRRAQMSYENILLAMLRETDTPNP